LRLHSLCNILSNERMCLSFTNADGPRQRSHSHVPVLQDSWPYFTVSDSRLPQPGGPGPCIYISQEQGGPVIPRGTGFPFRRLLRLAGLRWRYSNPPQHGVTMLCLIRARCIASGRTAQKTSSLNYFYFWVFTLSWPNNGWRILLSYSVMSQRYYMFVISGILYIALTTSELLWNLMKKFTVNFEIYQTELWLIMSANSMRY
jgi:hypothetical protein